MNRTLASYQQLGHLLDMPLTSLNICTFEWSLGNCPLWCVRFKATVWQMHANRLDCARSGQQFYHPWSPISKEQDSTEMPLAFAGGTSADEAGR